MQIGVAKNNYGKKIRDNKPQTIQKSVHELNNKKEQIVLKVTMYCSLFLAVLGISFGITIKSSALVFDGMVALIGVALGLLSVVTSRYIYRQDDDIFQYGYVRFEPMVNLFKSLILLITCVYALISGIRDIMNGGYLLDVNWAIMYTLCAFILCGIMYGYTTFYSKRLDSELIHVDRAEWLIDCITYLGGIIAFGWILLVDPQQHKWFSRYVDAALLVVLSLFLSITPLKIMIANLKDLIMVAPPELDDKITQIMEELSKEYDLQHYSFSKKSKEERGIYHINHINYIHSKIKEYMRKHTGISSKYLNEYLSLIAYMIKNKQRNLHDNFVNIFQYPCTFRRTQYIGTTFLVE